MILVRRVSEDLPHHTKGMIQAKAAESRSNGLNEEGATVDISCSERLLLCVLSSNRNRSLDVGIIDIE